MKTNKAPEKSGFIGGEIEAVPAGEDADNYVIIRKKHKEGEDEGGGGEETME